MRSEAEIRVVFRLNGSGQTQAAIARATGVPRSTVREWIADGEVQLSDRIRKRLGGKACKGHCVPERDLNEPAYGYLLGQYLGDGCISEMPRTFRLRISCCNDYPCIMNECERAIVCVRPGGAVGRVKCAGCTEVGSYWSHWPCFLPHGVGGVKHRRSIHLLDWQQRIAIDTYPQQFLRGLIHSGGWRGTNRVRGANGNSYTYPRYMFFNRSDDIKRLFVEACSRLGVEARRMNTVAISVAKRESVAILDDFIGPKS